MNKQNNILYIHGFNSSPLSVKAVQTRDYLAANHPEVGFYCPQLKTNSRGAIDQLENLMAEHCGRENSPEQENSLELEKSPEQENSPEPINSRWFLIGSSLGGYFAHYLAEKYALPAVLINPAVKPYQLLRDYPSEQTNPYTGEVYQIGTGEIDALKSLESNISLKNNYLVMLQTGDEVLNYRQAAAKYQDCHLHIHHGGDHSFVGYQDTLPDIMQFFQLPLAVR
ncbi:YqiA/YcfP family alpha/beta fold hydrolase [Thalassomonas sp. RHCl1]|uniref:YqiA/YcfP family alpha/beta fold hydrolase n=1 Tax=Thalassomonas sp. RHCl1 TaxID=2995320 RepID=UPI00248C2ECA|nr:YqiA/YcfP family alpha/beta fold hydrolase [Thalassomonas sp. RHCl1]